MCRERERAFAPDTALSMFVLLPKPEPAGVLVCRVSPRETPVSAACLLHARAITETEYRGKRLAPN